MKAPVKLAIKATVYNQIRKDLYKKILKEIKPEEKITFFDKVFNLNIDAHALLNSLRAKRKAKAKIQKERDARGYKPKKKRTTKAQWEAHLKEMAYVTK